MAKQILFFFFALALVAFTTFPTKTTDIASSATEVIAQRLDKVADQLIEMDTLSDEQRKQRQDTAVSTLESFQDLEISQELKDQAQDFITRIKGFDSTQVGANHLDIMTLIKDITNTIVTTGFDGLTFTDKGDFFVSYAMLNSRISDITWPGTHNSYSNNVDAERSFGTNYRNQGLSLVQQIKGGIRWLDMDVGPGDALGAPGVPAYFVHNSGTGGRVRFDTALNSIKDYVIANPDVIVIFEMADISNMNSGYAYGKLREAFYSTGLSEHVFNMRPLANKEDNASDVATDPDSINPKLIDMIGAGKNVLFVPHQEWYAKDRAYFKEIHPSGNIRQDYEATKLEERSVLTAVWDPENLGGQSNEPTRFMSLEFDPDDGSLAGNPFFAARNNDGRRLYQIAKWYEDRMPDHKHINYYKIDFFSSSLIGGDAQEPAFNSIVHACNTLNSERLNNLVSNNYKVQLYPDYKGSDLLRSDATLNNEVAEVTTNARNHEMQKSEWSQNSGNIKAGGRRRHKQGTGTLNWWCAPEFAMDNDFSTVWAADGTSYIEFNFGSPRNFRYVYIAWEYNMATPGFNILGSNGNGQWDTLATMNKVRDANSLFQKVDLGSTKSYQYIKLETTDVDNEARTGISEFYVYE